MASKLYDAYDETSLVFADSAQSPNGGDLTLSALAAGAGRISDEFDRGANSKPADYVWRATFQMATAGVIGQSLNIYLVTSDGTNADGEEGTVDAALSAEDKLLNMTPIGAVKVDTTSTNTDITASGVFKIKSRYFSIVVFNNTDDALKTDTAVHSVTVTPRPPENQ